MNDAKIAGGPAHCIGRSLEESHFRRWRPPFGNGVIFKQYGRLKKIVSI